MIIKGQKINDRYEIIRTIGEGGMANVYLAYDTILNRNVAVKILRGDLADDEKFVRRFQREAISSSSLAHPNIVEMYDVGEDDGKYYIVMEYIDGKTLKSLIKKRGALTLPEVIDIMLQVTSAIMCAHDSYIIHRDIKPQNIMILEDGRLKITDFGIAMALNSNELTQTNSVMGSVHYLPPEQASGSGSTIKSDIYSLGILMYELLTGKVPFKGDSAVEIAIKQMKDPIPSVCKKNEEIPQSVENIILKACAKNPRNRYENVGEMHEDIKHCLDAENMNMQRITYLYPEHDLEETKIMPKIDEKTINKETKEKTATTSKDKKLNIALISILSLLGVVIVGFVIFFLLTFGSSNKEKDTKVPNVSGYTQEQADTILREAKLNVEAEVEYQPSEEIAEGLVISTNPEANRTVSINTTVKLIVSSGSESFELEDYASKADKKYDYVEQILKSKGLIVTYDEIEVEDRSKQKKNIVVKQSIEPGTKVKAGDTIILYIPIITYPDFTDGNWTVTQVEDFCAENGVEVVVEEKISDKPEGTIIEQNRKDGVKVIANTTLKIYIAKKKPVQPPVDKEDNDDETPTKPGDGTNKPEEGNTNE